MFASAPPSRMRLRPWEADMTHHDMHLSRRATLAGMAGLVMGVCLPGAAIAQSGAARAFRGSDPAAAAFAPNAFVRVGSDDTVTVLIKHIEFGQGPFTGLATLVAEEMDADWSKVRAEHAPSNADLYKNFAFGAQGTGGSTAMANSYQHMGKVASFDATATRAVSGVVDVKQIPSGVAVYAQGFWPASKGRDLLRVTWDESSAERRSSADLIEAYRAVARRPGTLVNAKGDAEAALRGAERVIEAEFVFPYLAHAPMEPLDGYLQWDGERALARLGSQLQTGDHMTIAGILGLTPDKVEVETMLAGGSFGRRAQQDMHFAAELAAVAKAIGPGRAVKLMWTREDDIRGGHYRSLFVHRLRGGLRGGKIVAWASTSVGQSILQGSPFEAMIKDGIDPTSVEGANELPYEIADFRCDLHTP